MRLTLYQLEEARRNPRRFGEQLAIAEEEGKKGRYNSNNFRTYITNAVRGYHANQPWPDLLEEFLRQCRTKLPHVHFAAQRTARYEETLKGYFTSYPSQGVVFIEMEKRFSLGIGRHVITGKVDRLDRRRRRGYRATDIQINKAPWRRKLRWPIIQHALAEELGGSSAEVEVGVHCFETGSPDYHIFDHVEIEAALAEAEEICDKVVGYGGKLGINNLTAPIDTNRQHP